MKSWSSRLRVIKSSAFFRLESGDMRESYPTHKRKPMKPLTLAIILHLSCPILLYAPETYVAYRNSSVPKSPIEKASYKTWSLFLISDTQWLLPQNKLKLAELYEEFIRFGEGIGPNNLAVWFASSEPQKTNILSSIDLLRTSAFCESLKLSPSKGPYILITTEYPGEAIVEKYPETFPTNLSNCIKIEVNRSNSSEISAMLKRLREEIVAGDIRTFDPNSQKYWGSWQRAFENVYNAMSAMLASITVTIKGGPVDVVIKQ
jgi:hypothetical protein